MAFSFISSSKLEPSLFHSSHFSIPSPLVFYLDELFDGFIDFEESFCFFKDHFLSRVKWVKLILSFKKLKLFEESLVALNVVKSRMPRVFSIMTVYKDGLIQTYN